ncbi:MAG TPA: hypothetical protein PKL31_17605 [Fulvivirga sp.]|nr:hypothetical protein [Fulvivirga sp.]
MSKSYLISTFNPPWISTFTVSISIVISFGLILTEVGLNYIIAYLIGGILGYFAINLFFKKIEIFNNKIIITFPLRLFNQKVEYVNTTIGNVIINHPIGGIPGHISLYHRHKNITHKHIIYFEFTSSKKLKSLREKLENINIAVSENQP